MVAGPKQSAAVIRERRIFEDAEKTGKHIDVSDTRLENVEDAREQRTCVCVRERREGKKRKSKVLVRANN